MTVEILQLLSLGSYILAGIAGTAAVIMFIGYRIPMVIGDLSGVNARKAIENIRKQQKGDEPEEVPELVISEDSYQKTCKTALLCESQNSAVVEYEIGFWTSREIIEDFQ